MISTSCQSSSVDLVHQLADQRVGVEQVVGQQQFGLVVDLLEEKRHRLVQGIALSHEQQPVKLLVLVASQLQIDDLRHVSPGSSTSLGMFQDLRAGLPSGWLKTR